MGSHRRRGIEPAPSRLPVERADHYTTAAIYIVLFCVKRFCREEFDKNNNLTKHFYEFIVSH